MANYDPNEVVDILLTLGECRKNYRQAAILYAERYHGRRHPSYQEIINIERRSRSNALARQRQRNRNVNRNDPRLVAVLGMVHMDPHISTRAIERRLGIPRSTVQRMLRSVRYRPYHIHLLQELSAEDYARRLEFCRWALQQLDEDEHFFFRVCFSDEATFHNTGCLNRHNSHYWSSENPYWSREIANQHRWSLITWMGIVDNQIVGPHFFDRAINGEMYLHFLQQHLPVHFENVPLNIRQQLWFQQDGAPAHYYGRVRNFLDFQFPNRWIGRRGPIAWPPRSPDLSPLDYFLWGYLKNTVYENAPTTRVDMMERIERACTAINADTIRTAILNFRRRLNLCIQNNGGHFELELR